MGMVWMAKFKNIIFLRNDKGQSAVEYILLIAVLSSIGYSFYNNKRFKEFMGGEKGFFVALRKGMEYSYRYGRPLDDEVDYDKAMEFSYQSKEHDLYYSKKDNRTHFFTGTNAYGQE